MPVDVSRAARQLASARQAGRRRGLAARLRPADAAEAYAIQVEVERLLGRKPLAWKVGAPDHRTEPNAAPIYEVLASPARIDPAPAELIGAEAELAAVFGEPLPPRALPYSEHDVLTAVRAVCVAIELCDSRLQDWLSADELTKLADHQLNFALVTGAATSNFRTLDFSSLEVSTRINGTPVKQGTGTHAVGNPLRLLTWLVNHARERGGIAAETVVTTGAWLGLHPVQPGDEVIVEFPAIGAARVSIAQTQPG
jgi:2-keto-4-pentenoate hydratase